MINTCSRIVQRQWRFFKTKQPFYPVHQAPLYWVDTQKKLHRAVQRLKTEKVIGVDTETNSLYAYQEQVCLIQISSWDEDYIIDPLAFSDPAMLKPLNKIMAHPKITKVFHGADYDVGGIHRDFGIEFHNIFDTYLAARYLGYDKVGLQSLVDYHFNIYLDKTLTKYNWSTRPIPEAEMYYAREDVRYIIPLKEQLEKELKQKGIWEDVLPDFERAVDKEMVNRVFDPEAYTKIKGADALSPQDLRVLRELYIFREKKAEKFDQPSFKVLGEYTLKHLATIPDDQELEFNVRSAKGLPGYRRREVINGIVRVIRRARRMSPISHAHGSAYSRSQSQKKAKKRQNNLAYFSRRKVNEILREWRNQKANGYIDPHAVLPNFALEEILQKAPATINDLQALDHLGPARVKKYGPELLQILEQNRVAR